jgi:amidase
MDSPVFAPAHELAQAIRDRRISAVEVLEAHLAHLQQHNTTLNAVVFLNEEGARHRAHEADRALANGELWGPLHGVPFTLKDVHDTAGLPSTMGFPPLAERIAAADTPVVQRLKAAGGVLFGKTNAQLFPDNPFGLTRNPWDPDRIPGGSSSGAAAGLAAGLTPLDVGSDATGSILRPAHYCGVCAMRPTERRVPLTQFPTDPVPLWRSMLVLGPMARTVIDLQLALRIIAGPDVRDTEVPPVPWQGRDIPAIRDLRIAWSSNLPNTPIMPEIRQAFDALAHELQRLDATIQEALPDVNLAEQSQWPDNFFQVVVNAFATPPSSLGDYFTALHVRDTFIARWEQFFDEWDVLLLPVDIITARRYSELNTPVTINGETEQCASWIDAGVLVAATGQPAVVIPLGLSHDGLPFGLQLVGRRWEDEKLLAIAAVLESITGGYQRPPGY